MAEAVECSQSYFDGMPMSKRQKHFIFLLAAGTLLEQIDLYKFSFIAPALRELWGLTVGQIGQINAAFAVGGIMAAFVFGIFADKKGRKISMVVALFIGGIGALLSSVAPNFQLLLASRVVAGFGIAGALLLEAPYLVEMVPSEHRSRWQGILGIVAVLGIPISAVIAKALLNIDLNFWRYVAAIPSIAILIGILFWIMVPESPRWLVTHNQVDRAKRIFMDLTGKELAVSQTDCVEQKTGYGETFRIMFAPKFVKRTVLFFMIYFVLYNAGFMITQMLPTLLQSEGYPVNKALDIQQILTLSMIVAAFYLTIFGDMGGRKTPYAVAMFIVGVGALGVSMAGIDNELLLKLSVVVIGCVLLTNQSFSAVFIGECYPTRVRTTVSGVMSFVMRTGTLITQTFVVSALYNGVGFKGYFLILVGIYVAFAALIMLMAPRTTGISLEELASED